MTYVQDAYREWSKIYDSNDNKTRDLEGVALRDQLSDVVFDNCLEIGCGTGKNTVWFATKAQNVVAIDLSNEMLQLAQDKIHQDTVSFVQVDINSDWSFTKDVFDLVSFSLVLEHIENLDHIFEEASRLLKQYGLLYLGELHPFKQYNGSKARFETAHGVQGVDCFNHHISDFIRAANKHGLLLTKLGEYFDDDERHEIPRILTLLFQKK